VIRWGRRPACELGDHLLGFLSNWVLAIGKTAIRAFPPAGEGHEALLNGGGRAAAAHDDEVAWPGEGRRLAAAGPAKARPPRRAMN
jgi:hypothetical protein